MLDITYKDNNTVRFKITTDEPVERIVQLILIMRAKGFIYGKEIDSFENYDILEFTKHLFYTNFYFKYENDKGKSIKASLTENPKHSYIYTTYNLIITKEDLDQIIEILLNSSIFKNRINAEEYISNSLDKYSLKLGTDINRSKFSIIYGKIPKELTPEIISSISDYFKIEKEKLDVIKTIFQTNIILDTTRLFLNFKEPQLSECIKKFNFNFTIPPAEFENDLDEIIDNIFKKEKPYKINLRLSKHVTLYINKYTKRLELNISSLDTKIYTTIMSLIFNQNKTGAALADLLRKKYIYGFLYNNNLVSNFQRGLLKSSIDNL